MKNITVIGAGYVGLSLALLLSKNNSVSVLDIDESRVRDINQKNPILMMSIYIRCIKIII